MRIAGVYASAFLFFLFFKLLCMYGKEKQNFFLIFKTVVNMHKRETAMNHTPVYTFGLGYPPMTKTNLFTIQNSKHNEKD